VELAGCGFGGTNCAVAVAVSTNETKTFGKQSFSNRFPTDISVKCEIVRCRQTRPSYSFKSKKDTVSVVELLSGGKIFMDLIISSDVQILQCNT
jgi:hypothetical protein